MRRDQFVRVNLARWVQMSKLIEEVDARPRDYEMFGEEALWLRLETLLNTVGFCSWPAASITEVVRTVLEQIPAIARQKAAALLKRELEDVVYIERHDHVPFDAGLVPCRSGECEPRTTVTYEQLREQDPSAHEFVVLAEELRERNRQAYDELVAELRARTAKRAA